MSSRLPRAATSRWLDAVAEPNRSELLGTETAQSTPDRRLRCEQGQTAHAPRHWTRWFSAFVRHVSQRLANQYEPAKHYMRGPGPKTLEQRRKETA